MEPLVHELKPAPDVRFAFERFCRRPGCLLLDSAMRILRESSHSLGRYSFLMADPFDWIEHVVGTEKPFAALGDRLQQFRLKSIKGLPPFQSGYAGLLSYDLNQSLETSISSGKDNFRIPGLALGGYATLIAWDHQSNQAWIISSGFPETDVDRRIALAKSNISNYQRLVDDGSPTSAWHSGENFDGESERQNSGLDMLAGRFSVPGPSNLTSNFSEAGYLAAVQKCIDFVHAGDIFQVNLAQQLLLPAHQHAAQLYVALRECNPAPFSGYFNVNGISKRFNRQQEALSDFQIVSASPERFIAVRDGVVETRPIKGTRRRTGIPLVDIQAQEQLQASCKDRAENTMIVDLMRNDLSRCCLDDSIVVTQLCELERFQSVYHLVSAVRGRLQPTVGLVDLVESVFPGGSITGAPKPRAMQIIGELEPTARGAYCGALGYFGFDGAADFNILIRTITAAGGWWQIPVGGGIVSSSKPRVEYEETWTKAAGLLRAVEACRNNVKIPNSVSS